MPGETKHGIECTEFEALLTDALDGDGQLSPARKESFEAHRRACAICGPLFGEVQAGRHIKVRLRLKAEFLHGEIVGFNLSRNDWI